MTFNAMKGAAVRTQGRVPQFSAVTSRASAGCIARRVREGGPELSPERAQRSEAPAGRRVAGRGIAGHALVCAILIGSLLLAPIPSASAEGISIPEGVETFSDTMGSTVIDVPRGLRPTAVTGILSLDKPYGGDVDLLVEGRVVSTVEARPFRRVSIPLTPARIGERSQVEVGVRYRLPRTEETCQLIEPVGVSLHSLQLQYTGEEEPPSSLGDFFPANSPRVDVVIPPDASDDVLQAALAAVAALSHRYSAPTQVVLGTVKRLPDAAVGGRVVRFARGDGAVQTSIDTDSTIPALTLTGSGSELLSAARTLGSEQLSIADSDSIQGLALSPRAREAPGEVPLGRFASDDVALSGYGRSSAELRLPQDAFGGPVSSLDLHIEGNHSAVPDEVRSQLDVYLNDFLIGSQILDADSESEINLDLSVEASQIEADNDLEFALTALPAEGECIRGSRRLPMEVFIDVDRSMVTAAPGTGQVTGFGLFPQVFGGFLPVAIRGENASRIAAAIDAAYLISSLQHAAAAPLTVTLVDPDDFVAGDQSGLLVGALESDSDALQAPIRLDNERLLDSEEATLRVGSSEAFAALESAITDERYVLMLGAWSPNAKTPTAKLSRRAAVAAAEGDGWRSLNHNVLVASGDDPVFTVESEPAPPPGTPVTEEPSFGWWFGFGLAVLGLLMLLGLLRIMRRGKVAAP